MAFSSTYSATPITVAKSISTAPGLQYNPGAVTVGAGNTAIFYHDNAGNLLGRLANGAADPTGGIVTVATNVDTTNTTKVTSATVLTNGNVVVTWASQGSTEDIYFRIYDASLNPLTDATLAETTSYAGSHPDVAALAGGGFVIAWEKTYNSTDHDVVFRRFDASGVGQGDPFGLAVDGTNAHDEYPSVTGLADGGFALGFDRLASGNTSPWRAVRNADGSERLAADPFDIFGTINTAVDAVALPNGDFILTYEDSGWTNSTSNTDVTAARFTAAGTFIAYVQSSQATNNDGHTSAAVSQDGFTIISSTNTNGGTYDIMAALLAPDGSGVLTDQPIAGSTEIEFWSSANWIDPSHVMFSYGALSPAPGADEGGGVAARVVEIVRTSNGDVSGDLYSFLDDGIIDVVNAGGGNDTIQSGRGNDSISGGDGNDSLDGGSGADHMDGGAGSDAYVVDNTSDIVNEALGSGIDTVYASVGYALGAGSEVENLVAVGPGAFSLTGNEFANTITGGAGADILNGGAGGDVMSGGTGSDTYWVDNASDIVNEAPGSGTDTVYASVSYTLGAASEVESLIAVGAGPFVLTGNGFGNAVTGGAWSDTLDGQAGNDVLSGSDGDDRLYGRGDADILLGGSGRDVLTGGQGRDVLTGNAGKDAFLFDVKPVKKAHADKITDFSVRDDSIWLENAVFKALGKKGSLVKPALVKADFFHIGAAAEDTNDHLIYNRSTGALYYDADGTGGAKQVFLATLSKNLKMTTKDFFVV